MFFFFYSLSQCSVLWKRPSVLIFPDTSAVSPGAVALAPLGPVVPLVLHIPGALAAVARPVVAAVHRGATEQTFLTDKGRGEERAVVVVPGGSLSVELRAVFI